MIPGADEAPRESVYRKRLDDFAVSGCPNYRRLGSLHHAHRAELPLASSTACPDTELEAERQALGGSGIASADVWERLLGEDVRTLAREILVHICGDKCYKYTGAKMEHICRHGFYYIVSLAD